MKDEIKEIQERLDYHKAIGIEPEYCEDLITTGELQRLLDYITNSQEENKRLAKEIDMWNGLYNIEFDKARKYKSRNEKAIEKLESIRIFGLRSGKTLLSTLINESIDILQGEGKE